MGAPPVLSPESQQRMLRSLKGLMAIRLLILTLLLSITLVFQVSDRKFFFLPLTNSFYYFISLYYFVTILYAVSLRKPRNPGRSAFNQLVIDHLFITGLIYFTGGRESFFPVAYMFVVIGSSFLFGRRGAFFSASLAAILFGSLLVTQLYRWVTPLGSTSLYEASQIFYSLIVYMATFFIVAFLSSLISEELSRKQKELLQKQSDYHQLEAFNRNIIQSLDTGLLTIDLDGRITFWNRTAEKILCLEGRDRHSLTVADLLPNLSRAIGKMQNPGTDTSANLQRGEIPFVYPEGKKVHLGFSISPLAGPGETPMGHTVIFQDITRYKEMEELINRNNRMAAVGQLAAGLAHEIRNPLTSLSGSIQMLKADLSLEGSNQRLMDIILRESERLNALITDFLLFAHPPRTHKSAVDLKALCQETLDLFAHSQQYRTNIRICRPEFDSAVRVPADPYQIKQVLWNLLLNAAQSIPGAGEVGIELKRSKTAPLSSGLQDIVISGLDGEGWAVITVRDSGKGIEAADKEKIFEPFFTTKEGGTGLGLAIVHKIIENHKGVIRVESEVNKGTQFTLYLPSHTEEECAE
jgi:two-component system, NtrC family, sensor histidine kinase PilS